MARLLFERAARRVCLIEQDHYRFIFRPAGGGSLPNAATIHRMIEHNVGAALADGYDVILEGILSKTSYGEIVGRLLAPDRARGFLYSFAVSLDETLRRHATRATEDLGFSTDDMRSWFASGHPYGSTNERLILQSSSIDATVERIKYETGMDKAPT